MVNKHRKKESMDFAQLLEDLQKVHSRIEEGYVEEANELLQFVIDDFAIIAARQPRPNA